MSTSKKEVQKTADALPMEWMQNDLGAGMEGADKESFAIPFLSVLQTNSPQVDEAEGAYVEGSKPGMFLNSVTSELYDGKAGVIFIPCAYQRRFIRWGARGTDSGGFKGEIAVDEVAALQASGEIVDVDGRLYFPDENGKVTFDSDGKAKNDRLTDTRNHFGLVYDPETGTAEQVLLSLSSTQIKKSKQLMSLLANRKVKGPNGMVTPPTWANQIRITTIPEKNDKGKWHGIKVVPEGLITSQDIYEAGKAFHELIAAGEARAAYETMDAAGATETNAEEPNDGKF